MKNRIAVLAVLSIISLSGAMIWEGAAAVAPSGELPENGLYAATNSFPRNSVVDITNMENGRIVRVTVISGLETPGLLATISREAAGVINLSSRSIGRIRMSQPADFVLQPQSGGQTQSDKSSSPASALAADRPPAGYVPDAEWANDTYREIIDLPEYYTPQAAGRDQAVAKTVPSQGYLPQSNYIPEEYIIPGIAPANDYKAAGNNSADVYLDESLFIRAFEYAPPPVIIPKETGAHLDEAYFIDSLPSNNGSRSGEEAGTHKFDNFSAQNSPPKLFSVPLIDRLEQGKYYVQIGAFGSAELVEKEILKIGASYPVVIQNSGSSDKPLYRILLGPLNQGEGGAVLQRIKAGGYSDAFIRRN